MPPKRRLKKVLVIAAAVIAGYLFVMAVLAWFYVHPSSNPAHPIPDTVAESLYLVGGLTPAYVSPGWEKDSVVFICAHGYRGNRDAFEAIAPGLVKRGYGVVIPAMPGQDGSPIRGVGFGPEEAKVLVSCIELVHKKNFRCKIILLGESLGGAACWMASAMDPSQVSAVVSECGFANLGVVSRSYLDKTVPGLYYFLRPMIMIAQMMSGANMDNVNPVDQAAQWAGRPGLVIQGGDDQLVDLAQGQALAKAADVPLWVVPGAAHARCFNEDPQGCIDRLVNLASGALDPKPGNSASR